MGVHLSTGGSLHSGHPLAYWVVEEGVFICFETIKYNMLGSPDVPLLNWYVTLELIWANIAKFVDPSVACQV